MTGDVVLDLDRLGRRFGRIVAVDDVTFSVGRGAIFGLLGPNGSGKSTILRMLCGVLRPTSGRARVLGFDSSREAESVKRRIGYMSQQFSLYRDLSVAENLEFYGRIYGLDRRRLARRTGEVTELTGLGDRLDQGAGTLSGGWKQRLALACALIHEPEVLFLDEPTAGIDPVARRELWDLLFELAAGGVTQLVTTHSMDEAERCTDIGYLYLSRLIVCGRPEEIKARPEVTPAGMAHFELRAPEATTALTRIRTVVGVADATLFGQHIHLLGDADLPPGRVAGALGLDEEAIGWRAVEPSLEDVFVTLTRAIEAGRAGPPAVDLGPAPAPADEGSAGPVGRPADPTRGLAAIFFKELAHIRREPSTLFFLFLVPVIQCIIFGYALDVEIEDIPLVVLDHDGRSESQRLAEAFETTGTFTIVEWVQDEESFRRALTSGRAKAGLRIPPDFSDRILEGRPATVQVLIDGSDSQVATTALAAANLIGATRGERSRPTVDVRPRLLYNPDLESARFFVPGLVGIILQLVTLFLTSFAIVKERELGTLEQLFVTPVGRLGLLLGKLLPYAGLGMVEMLVVLTVMVHVFGVPIQGSLPLLLVLSILFLVCALGLGLLVSTIARTQVQAIQMAFVIMLPSVLLSGFVFPRSEMPAPIYVATFAIPATYFLEILRGIVLRAADLEDLARHVAGLAACTVVVLGLSAIRFRKETR